MFIWIQDYFEIKTALPVVRFKTWKFFLNIVIFCILHLITGELWVSPTTVKKAAGGVGWREPSSSGGVKQLEPHHLLPHLFLHSPPPSSACTLWLLPFHGVCPLSFLLTLSPSFGSSSNPLWPGPWSTWCLQSLLNVLAALEPRLEPESLPTLWQGQRVGNDWGSV